MFTEHQGMTFNVKTFFILFLYGREYEKSNWIACIIFQFNSDYINICEKLIDIVEIDVHTK